MYVEVPLRQFKQIAISYVILAFYDSLQIVQYIKIDSYLMIVLFSNYEESHS